MLASVRLEKLRAFVQNNYPGIAHDMDDTLEDIILIKLLHEAEEAFRQWDTDDHTFYHIEQRVQKNFAFHMGDNLENFANAFFVVTKRQAFGVLYILSKHNIIMSFKHISGRNNVANILKTFQGHLTETYTDDWRGF